MERAEIDSLVARLVENPHDGEALAYAHAQGEADPKAYAMMLERVGGETRDPSYAAHWLAEAANVWSTTLGDAHRAARVLMMAIDKDPTSQVAAERLSQLYRDKGDTKALVALLDRRAKAIAPLAAQNAELRPELAGMHEELGRLWADAPLSQPKKAIENFKKAIELDPTSAYAIYNARELYKQVAQWSDAVPLYAAELELEEDPTRRVGLLRDEAQTRKLAGDLRGATRALARAREIDEADPALQQEYASSVLDRLQANETVDAQERTHAAELLVALAEAYEGEHGLAYAGAALDIQPAHDRALQLLFHYARALGTDDGLASRARAYLKANPSGHLAVEARSYAGTESVELELDVDSDPREGAPGSQRGGRAAALERAAATTAEAPTASSPSVEESTKTGASLTLTGSDVVEMPVARASAAPASTSSSSDDDARSDAPRRAPMSPEKLQGVLDAAQMLAGKGKKPEAYAKYKEVLDSDPAHPEALGWVEDYLRGKRDYAQLKDVLLASIRASANDPGMLDTRKERLREVAGLCEGNLRDIDAATAAWRQLLALDRKDETARTALMRLLERTQRWDDLANLLEQEATIESDIEQKILLERKLARLQEEKRKDLVAAGEAHARIARLVPDDEQAVMTASRLFERGDRADLAAQILAESSTSVDDPVARGQLLQKLAELREQLGQATLAGDSYAEAADALRNGRLWEEAERLYAGAEAWEKAAHAAHQRGLLTGDAKQQAACLTRSSEHLTRAGRSDDALARLEEATNLDPLNDDYAALLVARYTAKRRIDALVAFLTRRGDRLSDRGKRTATRREAATLAASLEDKELSRELWLKLLEDGDDKEALERLIDDAVQREDHTEAATLLRRLGQNTVDKAEKARVALREAELLADGVGDVDTAISRYESILADLDATCRPALQAIADLEEARGGLVSAADALERELKLVADVQERGQIAARLARIYEKLDDPKNAIRALDLVRKADLEDFDALTRLCELCELTEQWSRVAELLVERIEVEGDENEVVELTKKLARILADKLDRGDEALGALTDLADHGNASVREAYIELGDRLGWKGIVASKLKDWWFDARHGEARTAALRGAFERFAEVGRDADAVAVAIELIRTKGADRKIAEHLEELAVKTSDLDALAIAHDVLAREVQGEGRAPELVRQAEVRVRAGMPRVDAISHGEAGLPFVAPADAEPLLERLAALAPKPGDVIDLYERQVTRSKQPQDRIRALARAAQVASQRGQPERARGFFELALSGAPSDETIDLLEASARDGDKAASGDKLRRALCVAFSAGGHGARDGGRTRATLLRRAATIVQRDLNDLEQAFTWLADALVAHVDALTLDMLEGLGTSCGDPRRADGAISHALTEVFDGPLVRQLLARRAKIRREQLREPVNAAADLKRLHDLSPGDQAVLDELAALYMELGDFKSLVSLYEDQILRGKDMNARAELARKVARVWEEQLGDAREAADAWRRVLRMRAGDAEATAGLERAKAGQLKKGDGDLRTSYAPPKLASQAPAPRVSVAPRNSVPPPAGSPTPLADAIASLSSPPPAETRAAELVAPSARKSVPDEQEARPKSIPPTPLRVASIPPEGGPVVPSPPRMPSLAPASTTTSAPARASTPPVSARRSVPPPLPKDEVEKTVSSKSGTFGALPSAAVALAGADDDELDMALDRITGENPAIPAAASTSRLEDPGTDPAIKAAAKIDDIPEELGSSELLPLDEPSGVGLDAITLDDDEDDGDIVIADDLADDGVDDALEALEKTDTRAAVVDNGDA